MIRVLRGEEPAGLRLERELRLPVAYARWVGDGRATQELKDLLVGYDVAKPFLFQQQHKKCAYCERRPGYDGQPVEHFRPKKEARRSARGEPRVVDPERYWWLTWTWENLLFSCHTCNGAARKGNFFPLRPGALSMPVNTFDTSVEAPLLLDPAEPGLDPVEHLVWVPVDRTIARPRWSWRLEARTDRGTVTATTLGLEDRADEVGEHYRTTVWPRFRAEVERPIDEGDLRLGHNGWGRVQRELVRPECDLVAATWSVLETLRGSTPTLRDARLPQPSRP